MPRPKNKTDLLEQSMSNYHRLLDFIETLPKKKRDNDFPKGTLNRNIRDVLAHLHHWHLLVQEWYKIGMKGEKPEMPAPGYTWKTTPDLNKEIQKKYSEITEKKALDLFKKSFQKVRGIIEEHTNDELFTKKHFKWTGSTSLGAYLISATSSHYDWAYRLIKKQTK